MNISGVLVRAYPDQLKQVSLALTGMAGVEVHANDAKGRLVVTVEQEDASLMADALIGMQSLPGVLSASMIYHRFAE